MSKRLSTLLAFLLLFLTAFGWLQRDAIYDWTRLRGYQPPAQIASLADQTTMTDPARRLFYVNHPELVNRSSFSRNCPANGEQSVVLGCYKSTQRGIYLLDVDRSELAGVEQVTAAHEMLHAAYDRISAGEKTDIDKQLQDFYDNGLKDDKVRATIDSYRKTEPDALVNEMHSILGTQVADLPDGLEQHYKQYFSDRQAIIKYYQAYEAAFSERQARIDAFDKQLDTLKSQIDTLTASAEQGRSDLQNRRAALERSDQGNAAAYNQQVDAYNSRVNTYNVQVRRLQTLVAEYNQIVKDRNAIAVEERSLVQSLTAPQQLQ